MYSKKKKLEIILVAFILVLNQVKYVTNKEEGQLVTEIGNGLIVFLFLLIIVININPHSYSNTKNKTLLQYKTETKRNNTKLLIN